MHYDCVHYDELLATSQPELVPTEVGELWKAINTKQKQMTTVCNNVTQIFRNSVEFVADL